MKNEFWLNLPVKDVQRSKDFYTAIGFTFSAGPGNSDTSASMVVGNKNITLMLFEEKLFKGFVRNEVTDANTSNEVLFSFGADSREEVDAMMARIEEAGGKIFAPAGDAQGWMYGGGFSDPDGHRWNPLYMDMSKLPK